MHVDDVGQPVPVAAELRGGQAQQAEAERVVAELRAVGIVDAAAREKAVVLDEPNRHAAIGRAAPDAAAVHFAAAARDQAGRFGRQAVFVAGNGVVKRQDDADVRAEAAQGLGQTGHHVAQPAALGVGRAFRGHEQHVQAGGGGWIGFCHALKYRDAREPAQRFYGQPAASARTQISTRVEP